MERKKRVWAYRIFQGLFILMILPQTIAKATHNEQFIAAFTALGYPVYMTRILLFAYVLGFIGILQTKFMVLREWAYAGFTFALVGAFFSHVVVEGFSRAWWALLPLSFLLTSYFLYQKLAVSKV